MRFRWRIKYSHHQTSHLWSEQVPNLIRARFPFKYHWIRSPISNAISTRSTKNCIYLVCLVRTSQSDFSKSGIPRSDAPKRMLFQRIRHFTIESFVVSFYEFDTLLFETISYWFSKRTIKLAFQKVPPNDQITYAALPNSKCEIRHNRLYHSIIPRIFQYGSDGVRALLSGFSNLEILISFIRIPYPEIGSGLPRSTSVYYGHSVLFSARL
ncbi:hypothetical protein LEP1GSC068_3431 [Leptospira sp. Fiocruz LV3954]|nr:hypothetical protein LEP1GSC068_3431 [Leptospira sp. Fiocruz LV3954]